MTLLEYHRLRHEEEGSWDRARLREEAGSDFVSGVEARLPVHQEVWAPDKLMRFVREPWFEACCELCDLYAGATEVQRSWVRSRVEAQHAGKIGLFALRAAILGARERRVELVRDALIAYAIRDLGHDDIRDVLIGLTLIVHCAGLAGADVSALLREIAAMCGPALGTLYGEWAAKYPEVAAIGSMGWRQVDTPDGVGFRQ